MYVKVRHSVARQRNIKGRSCNRCRSWQALRNTYSGCAFVALGIKHAKRMRHIVICGMPGSTIFFHIMIWYDMIYILTAVGLSPGGSTNLHTNNKKNNTNNYRTTQITTNVEECGPCPVFASFILAFALQLRKKARKKHQSG